MPDNNNVVIKINFQKNEKKIDKNPESTMVTEWNVKRILIAFFLFVILVLVVGYFLFKQPELEISGYQVVSNQSKKKPEIKINQITNNSKEIIIETTSNIKNQPYSTINKEIELISEKKKEVVILNDNNDFVDSDNNIDSINIKASNLVKNNDNVLNSSISEDINILNINNSQPDISDKLIISNDTRVVRALLSSAIRKKEPQDILISPIILAGNRATGIVYFTELLNMKGDYVFHEWWWQDKLVFKKKISILGNRWRASTSKLISYSKIGIWNVRLVNGEGVILNNLNFEVVIE